ncbi:MAG TPA: C_GCAxxG_C_C family protein [Lutibacter sp.]|nr:C_GCAxxG_C_C family protein [Lutibacter sp.]
MNKKDKAIKKFYTTSNCAQAVVTSFAEELQMDEIVLNKIASGFGAGMGKLQKTCGALTGGVMVIGLKKEGKLDKNQVYELVQNFESKFKEINQNTDCRQLLNCDLNTEEGQKYFNENNLKDSVCTNCVKSSIAILKKLI